MLISSSWIVHISIMLMLLIFSTTLGYLTSAITVKNDKRRMSWFCYAKLKVRTNQASFKMSSVHPTRFPGHISKLYWLRVYALCVFSQTALKASISPSIYSFKNWDSKKLSSFAEVTQLENGNEGGSLHPGQSVSKTYVLLLVVTLRRQGLPFGRSML